MDAGRVVRVVIRALAVCLALATPAAADTFADRWAALSPRLTVDSVEPVSAQASATIKRPRPACRPHRERVKVYRRNGKSWRYVRKWVRC